MPTEAQLAVTPQLGPAERPQFDDNVIAHIRNELPDSPGASCDDWALSSVGVLSDMEDDTPEADPSLVMPRLLAPSTASPGKLRVLVAGEHGVGKSLLIERLVSETPDAIAISHGSFGPFHETRVQVASGTPRGAMRIVNSCPVSPWPADSTNTSPGPDDEFNFAFLNLRGYERDSKPYAQALSSFLDTRFHETACLLNGFSPSTVHVLEHATSLRHSPHADCCLYLFGSEVTLADITVLHELSPYVPIVPLLVQPDNIDSKELARRKDRLSAALVAAEIATVVLDSCSPHAISTRYEYNPDMDASAVMAADYRSHVLVPSDLGVLRSSLFSDSCARRLRRDAAQLFSKWVSAMHLKSTLHHRISRPFEFPHRVELDVGWELARYAQNSDTPGAGNPVLTIWQATPPKCRRRLESISNLDPLDLNRWGEILRNAIAVALAVCGIHIINGLNSRAAAPVPAPAPPKFLDIVREWLARIRSAMVR